MSLPDDVVPFQQRLFALLMQLEEIVEFILLDYTHEDIIVYISRKVKHAWLILTFK